MARKKLEIGPEGLKALDECARRISGPKDQAFIRKMLGELLLNNALPVDLLAHIPVPPREAGTTRFDQLYSAAMSLVFPEYRENTLSRLLGQGPHEDGIRVWRAIFPDRYKLTHVLLRAHTYQQAFALACDYACRVSLYMFKQIPADLTIRILFVSESAMRRHLTMREITRHKKRHELKLQGRKFTDKQVAGARLAALGPPRHPDNAIFRYVEQQDMRKVRESTGKVRVSAVQAESFRPSARK